MTILISVRFIIFLRSEKQFISTSIFPSLIDDSVMIHCNVLNIIYFIIIYLYSTVLQYICDNVLWTVRHESANITKIFLKLLNSFPLYEETK